MSLLEFPQVARREFGIRLVELNSPFFEYAHPDSPDAAPAGAIAEGYLEELRGAAQAAGVGIVGIAVDHHGDLSSPSEPERSQAVRRHAAWIEVCKALGCDWFRANSGAKDVGPVTKAHEQACVRSFAELAEQAGRSGITVLMENHWGLSADPKRMVGVLAAVDNEYCGALADFRNWPPQVDPYYALAAIAPYTKSVHAKFLSFDDRGDDPHFDAPRALQILRQAGFAGRFAIEFEGELDDHLGVLKSKELLERLL
jgi:sugar phosphate isomerase/epimerase